MIQTLNSWLGLVALLLAIVNTIWIWLRTSGADNAAKFKEIEEDVEQKHAEVCEDLKNHDRRIQALEGEMKHLPSQEAVSALTISITELNGKLGIFDAEMGSLTRTVRRIEDHLRERA